MGIGDYICVTLRGGAPWGFTLREGEGDTYRPLVVTQVDEDGRAFLAGVRDDDEAVSLNGEPCADLTLLQALELIDTSTDCLQLLVKRYSAIPSDDNESEETSCSERDSSGELLESTTLHIVSAKHKELHISESKDEADSVVLDTEFLNRPQLLCTELHTPSCGDQKGQEESDGGTRRCLSPGNMVELQVSLSEQNLDDFGSASLGCALGIEGGLSKREASFTIPIITTTASHDVPSSVREPLSQRGVVLSSPSMLGQVEVILQKQPAASGAGRGILDVGGSVGSQSEGEEGEGLCEEVPGSFTVSFGIHSEEGTAAEEQDSDSDSEGDQDKPNKHRAKHARLRRGESQSEKQLKEAKSKCKRIALLLTAAPPNPNNKGVLMFKKHRQRAKKYTLVSYGTGEDEPDYSDEEDEENEDKQGTHTVELTLLAPNKSGTDKHFLADAQSGKGVLTINLDKGLLEIERSLKNQAEMESLPETKGKGALMFAQRRLRMDEISAEHEQLRSQGIPVEGVVEAEKKIAEHTYMQSTTEGHAYMDVNIHQQSQQQQQYQRYQEQQFYEQQQNYQQQQQQYQQQQQQYQQQYQQQQYEQQQYQQQMYQQQQQQEYHQEQQQMQHYSTNINGSVQHQTSEMQSSFSNRTAKPFSAENLVNTTYSPAVSGTNQDSMGQGEQIASRDERISTPAIRSGLLMDARKRTAGKPMFTFKEAPKVSPNPALLNLLNRGDRKPGFESGPEEDYLSLGAEACNFLQPSRVKPKIPPPVAPKPVINPNSPPWSPQLEVTNQDMPLQAENSVSAPAVAPTTETTLGPEPEPAPAPAPEPSPPPAPQEAPASTRTEEQPTWTHQPEPQQQPLQVPAKEENSYINPTQQPQQQPEHAPVVNWPAAQTQAPQQPPTNSWHPTQVQPQEPPPSQSPPQPPWVTRQPPQIQAQVQPPTNNWTPPVQQSWNQPQEQPVPQQQYQSPWTQPQEHPNQQQMQPSWNQDQTRQQPQPPWVQPSQTEAQHQPPWVTQQQQQSQPPWVHPVQPEPQPQPPWAQQPQQQAPHQVWPQAQATSQPQPPWVTAQSQQQEQPSMNTWPPSQTQVQPPWVQAGQTQPPAQPQANLNPWAPVPAQPEPQPSWAQQPPEHTQHPMNSWAQDQNHAQQQPPWAQPIPPQPAPQSNWQQSPTRSPAQPINAWPPAQTQAPTPVNTWAPQAQQTPVNASSSILNPRPSPKPWNPPQSSPQNRTPPPPPQRMHSFTIGQRVSSPINPMATVLNPSSQGSALQMPAVKGKGADMFAKRQSRMEKFVVDSETVQANKAVRSTSPVASLPNEWKYTPNTLGRSYSLSPLARVPSTGQRSASSSPKPPSRASSTPPARQTNWPEKVHKPPSPWEAASRHPLGLVEEAFPDHNLQQTLATNIRMAAQRKILPEPPAEWKARVSYPASQKTGSQTWSQGQSQSPRRAPLPSFLSPTRSTVSSPAGYRSLPRQWQPQRSSTEGNLGPSLSYSEYTRPQGNQSYKPVYSSNTWSWRR